MKPGKVYLGDSVYSEPIGESIRLTTENGFGPSNEIWLDRHVLDALLREIGKVYNVKIDVQTIYERPTDEVPTEQTRSGARGKTQLLCDQDG